MLQHFVARTGVAVLLGIGGEVSPFGCSIPSRRFAKHRDMRRDPALTIQLIQHLARAEGCVHKSPDVLRRVMDLVGEGVLKPHVSHRSPLDQAADAHRMAEQGGDGHGRIVLDIPPL